MVVLGIKSLNHFFLHFLQRFFPFDAFVELSLEQLHFLFEDGFDFGDFGVLQPQLSFKVSHFGLQSVPLMIIGSTNVPVSVEVVGEWGSVSQVVGDGSQRL